MARSKETDTGRVTLRYPMETAKQLHDWAAECGLKPTQFYNIALLLGARILRAQLLGLVHEIEAAAGLPRSSLFPPPASVAASPAPAPVAASPAPAPVAGSVAPGALGAGLGASPAQTQHQQPGGQPAGYRPGTNPNKKDNKKRR